MNVYILANMGFYSAIQCWLCWESYCIMIKWNLLSSVNMYSSELCNIAVPVKLAHLTY